MRVHHHIRAQSFTGKRHILDEVWYSNIHVMKSVLHIIYTYIVHVCVLSNHIHVHVQVHEC